MSWRDLERAAPELAGRGRERLAEAGVALLGTLRRDGSPRVSPVEPFFAAGELLLGSMTWSPKTHDLERDPRCVLHSAITGPHTGAPELKLYGRAGPASAQVRDACREGWWHKSAPSTAAVFVLAIEEATYVEWDYQRGEMTVTRWTPRQGASRRSRAYP